MTAAVRVPGGMPWMAAAAASLAFAGLALTSSEDGPVLCLFRRCTGGYCPGCGLTRAGGELIRGDVAASWRQHPFVLLAAAQIVIVGLVALARARRQPQGASRQPLLATRHWNLLAGVNVALLLVIWVTRLVSGAIPAPFF